MIVLSSFRARQEAHERDLAVEALKVADGSVTRAAALTGLHRAQLRRIVAKYKLLSLLKRHNRTGKAIGGNAAWRSLADA